MNKYLGGTGPYGAKIVIISDNPQLHELDSGKVSPPKDLYRLAREVGLNIDNCWYTYVVKEYVIPNTTKKIPFAVRCKSSGVDLPKYINELREELKQLAPNLIICLGGTPLWVLTGHKSIHDYRGSILSGWGFKLIATYNPDDLNRKFGEISSYYQRQIIRFDLKRALDESYSPIIDLPKRTLHIANSADDFRGFVHQFKEYKHPAIDIEAHPNGSCIPISISAAFTPSFGITAPLWNCDGISSIPDGEMALLWIELSRFLSKHDIIGQNFKYDQDKKKRLGFIIKSLRSDTMLKSFAINPELPKNLAFNTSIHTREPFYKNEGMYEGKIEDLLLGGARDACVTKEIDISMEKELEELGLVKFFYNFLMKLHSLYFSVEETGILVDETKREALLRKYISWDEKLKYELYKIAGYDINVGSWQQVDKLLYEILKIPRRQGTSEEVLTGLLNNVIKKENQKQACENILLQRRVKKTINQYALAIPDFDGRMRTSYFICLETGRTATSIQDPPIRPWVETRDENNKKKYKALGASFQTITKHGDIGPDVRTMYVADPGFVFISADSEQAEARVTSLLAEDYEMLEAYNTHDIHALTASWFFGGTEDDWSKKKLGYECPQRFIGKTLRHAGERGAKGNRAAIEVNTSARKYGVDINISKQEADYRLKIFHEKTPNIQAVYFRQVEEELARTRMLVAPLPYGVDAESGGKRIFFERWGDELNRQAFSYIPQRAVSDNTKAAALRIRERAPWLKLVIEAHDGLLFLCPIGREQEAGKIIKEEMERPIDFTCCSLRRELPLIIPCALEIGTDLYESKKFKLL